MKIANVQVKNLMAPVPQGPLQGTAGQFLRLLKKMVMTAARGSDPAGAPAGIAMNVDWIPGFIIADGFFGNLRKTAWIFTPGKKPDLHRSIARKERIRTPMTNDIAAIPRLMASISPNRR